MGSKLSTVAGALWFALGCLSCAKTDPRSSVTDDRSEVSRSSAANSSSAALPASLSKASIRRVQGLTQPLNVELYISRSSPRGDAFAKTASELMARYSEASRGADGQRRLAYTLIDPRSDAEKKQATEAGIQESTFGEGSDASVTLTRMFSGLVIKYGSESQNIPILPPEEPGLELLITQRIDRIRRVVEHNKIRVGVLVGKGGVSMGDDVMAPFGSGNPVNARRLVTQYFPYELVDVDLDGGKSPIADDLHGLIVTQPGSDLSDDELRRIDEFVLRGDTALAVFASAVDLRAGDTSLTGHLDRHHLDNLLAGYGVTLNKDAVLDAKAGWALANPSGSGANPIVFPWIPELDPGDSKNERRLDDSFLPFRKLSSLVFPCSSSLTLQAQLQPETHMRVVGRSSSSAVVSTSDKIDVMDSVTAPPTSAGAPRVLGVALEAGCCDGSNQCAANDACQKGLIHSTFSDPSGKVSAKPSRILVIASAQFFANPFARATVIPAAPSAKPRPKLDQFGEQLALISRPFLSRTFTTTLLALSGTIEWLGADADLAELARRDANPIR